ncbi:MAG: glutaredoxin domain-containing protein [Xanthomonadales bacterium]|nr:glutaredoxin domain-containing protein [Xanthomonadales bacterium]
MEVIDRIRQQLDLNPIVLYMKGSPQRPTCRGSWEASRTLGRCGAEFLAVDIQLDPEIRAYLPKYSDWPSFPQLFMQGEFIGGNDIIRELYEQGELCPMVLHCQPPQASNG